MNAVVLLGPPGAGKGTVAEALVERGYRHVSTGALLREQIRLGTPLGREAAAVMEQGGLVPDDVVVGMIGEMLRESGPGAKFLFDGFPRTLAQAGRLDGIVRACGGTLGPVFLLDCPEETVVARLSGRRTCPSCGAVYHIEHNPPRQPGVCDVDGKDLVQRPDDQPATIRKRLEAYARQTAPLVGHYEDGHPVCRVDAAQGIGEVRGAVLDRLGPAVP